MRACRPLLPRADRVHQQRLVVRVAPLARVPLDRRVEVPRVDHVVGEDVLAVVVQVQLDLLEDLLGDLLRRALLRRLAVEDPGRVPVGDVDREAVELAAVAVVAREVAVGPELRLGQRGQRPRRVDEGQVAADHVERLLQVVLDAVHPVDVELVHQLERRVRAQHGGRPQLPRALGRHRADEPVGLDRCGAARGGRARGRRRPGRAASRAPRRRGRRGSARRARAAA